VVPSFNVPYLPMVEPVIRAVADTDSFAFIATARLEWYKFEAQGLKPVKDAFNMWDRPEYVRLHLDHVPVIDEDNARVDYIGVL
jgi:fructose/tagatose bisphosphate aldolase